MRDEYNERFPLYIPLYYRVFLKLRKVYRQTMVRWAESAARRKGPKGIVPDGDAYWFETKGEFIPNPANAINKGIWWLDEDMAKVEVKVLAEKINAIRDELQRRGLHFTTTAATFISRMFTPQKEMGKLWQNTWTIYHSGIKPGHRVLDVGGASTAFSFYLASIGCSVAVVDNDWNNCGIVYNTNYVAKKMGWALKAYDRSIARPLPFPNEHFDCVFSICTVEHLPSKVRHFMMKEIGRVLKRSGIVGLTMDYVHNRKVLLTDKGLRFAYRDKLEQDVIRPSGLKIYGNTNLIDFHHKKSFLGALFLRKD